MLHYASMENLIIVAVGQSTDKQIRTYQHGPSAADLRRSADITAFFSPSVASFNW